MPSLSHNDPKFAISVGLHFAASEIAKLANTLWRKSTADFYSNQRNDSEEALADSVRKVIDEQITSAETALKALAAAGSSIPTAESIFNPSDWTSALIDASLPPMLLGMVQSAGAEYVRLGNRARDFEKASTATEWLNDQTDGGFEDLEFLVVGPDGTPSTVTIQITTEYPEAIKQEIENQLKETFAQDYWVDIGNETLSDIHQFLQEGLVNGASIVQMAESIRSELGGTSRQADIRAKRIARTEMTNALNGARSAAIDEFFAEVPDLPMKKVWLSILADTTRPEHADLDGVPADEENLWTLAGYRVRWPGDIILPAKHRCHCLCTVHVEFGMTDAEARQLRTEYDERVLVTQREMESREDG